MILCKSKEILFLYFCLEQCDKHAGAERISLEHNEKPCQLQRHHRR